MHWDRHPSRLPASGHKGTPWRTNPFLPLHGGCLTTSPKRSGLMCEGCICFLYAESDLLLQLSARKCLRAASLTEHIPCTKALLAETQPCMKYNEMDSQASFFFFLGDWTIMPANSEGKFTATEGSKINYFPFTSDLFQFFHLNYIQHVQQVAPFSVILGPHLLGKAADRRTLTNTLALPPPLLQLGTSSSLAENVLVLWLFFDSDLPHSLEGFLSSCRQCLSGNCTGDSKHFRDLRKAP